MNSRHSGGGTIQRAGEQIHRINTQLDALRAFASSHGDPATWDANARAQWQTSLTALDALCSATA